MIHPLAWAAWVGAVLVSLSLTRNPLYLGLILLWLTLTSLALPTASPEAKTAPLPISPRRFALFVVAVSALFNALLVHFGRTVLFHLPDILPVIGGVITLEAIVFGALNGLALAGIFTAFTIINQALSVQAIIRLMPRAFYPVAVVAAIAITFVPVTLRQIRQIREAQAIRGHRLHGWRAWLPLLMPLLVGGLERALQLAEAMTARGFAGTAGQAHDTKTRLGIITGLAALLGGWLLRLVWGQKTVGFLLLCSGIALIGGVLWYVGRRTPRTVYRPRPWRLPDGGVVLCAVATTTLFLFPFPGLDRTSIFYYPYPAVMRPTFDLLLALATAGLLAPAVVLGRKNVTKDKPARVLQKKNLSAGRR